LQNGEGPVNNTANPELVYPLPSTVSSVPF
jgi:hypothetical protein